MKNVVAASLALLIAQSAFAGLLTLKNGASQKEGVNIADSATASVNGQNSELSNVGSGVRTKKVLVANVKVYVAQILVDQPARFQKDENKALASLDESNSAAIRLTFLRTVEADKVQVSFQDALRANGITAQDSETSKFLNAVNAGGDAEQGKALTIVVSKKADGSETLAYENTSGKVSVIEGSKGFMRKVFSIWLGKPVDNDIAALKKQLLQ